MKAEILIRRLDRLLHATHRLALIGDSRPNVLPVVQTDGVTGFMAHERYARRVRLEEEPVLVAPVCRHRIIAHRHSCMLSRHVFIMLVNDVRLESPPYVGVES
jgi:hypothetical protein